MENLLKNSFTTFYHIPYSNVKNIALNTNELYFEIEDNNREMQLHTSRGNGMAKYSNPQQLSITIINYDKFITSLPSIFQQGKKRCDFIVYSANNTHFLLNELKDRKPTSIVITKAKKQLLESLKLITAVNSIQNYIANFSIKRCCYFNKQAHSPQNITATNAFNRLNTLAQNGFKMSYPDIETFGFEYYEYSGNQIYVLV
ncbi:MAG: hypothetical protein LBT27_03390 [Prevotellaceae bacterium]|jgi:hypothetical protein|nr:hypothetical protein [Prevotellaceae bacterium]